jgi:hypothetical protein
MNGTPNPERSGGLEILSGAEEDALSRIRTFVAEVRALGARNELERLTHALVSSGGAAVAAGAEGNAVILKLGEAHVTLRTVGNGIEVSFPGDIR